MDFVYKLVWTRWPPKEDGFSNLTSLTRGEANARRLLEIVRGHWIDSTSGVIRNGLHWERDVVFRIL